MDLQELISIQKKFDDELGLSLHSNDIQSLLTMINKDLIGLFGEIGEFANIIKKLNLENDRLDGEVDLEFSKLVLSIEDELIDSLVYMIRLFTHLGVDIESAYLRKQALNKQKYSLYRSKMNTQVSSNNSNHTSTNEI